MEKSGIVKLGLVVAEPGKQIHQLKRFLKTDGVDVFLFPEDFLQSDQMHEACRIVEANGKWAVIGVDDRRDKEKKYSTAIVIGPDGCIVGEHRKTSIGTVGEERGYSRGDSIEVIETDFGLIGVSICYELFFPEVSRVYALKGARIIFNPIGVGMFGEKQFLAWNSLASARASENNVFVAGCSHFNEAIPIAFAYAPDGECLTQSKNEKGLIKTTLELNKYPAEDKKMSRRRPELYGILTE